jgi:hypothetical protein
MGVDQRGRALLKFRDVVRLPARTFARDLLRERDQRRRVGARDVWAATGPAPGEERGGD